MSIRVPPDVAAEVKANAAAARRSINREVELYVEEALERRRQQREYPHATLPTTRVAEGEPPPYQASGPEPGPGR
jgi:hypothetical protein